MEADDVLRLKGWADSLMIHWVSEQSKKGPWSIALVVFSSSSHQLSPPTAATPPSLPLFPPPFCFHLIIISSCFPLLFFPHRFLFLCLFPLFFLLSLLLPLSPAAPPPGLSPPHLSSFSTCSYPSSSITTISFSVTASTSVFVLCGLTWRWRQEARTSQSFFWSIYIFI